MPIKACIYKGCKNFTVDNITNLDFTLFQFPQDKERREKWMKHGKVPKSAHQRVLLMCSDHFDSKYISLNPRRRLLVGPAVPRPYEGPTENTNESDSEISEIEENQNVGIVEDLIEDEHNQFEEALLKELNYVEYKINVEDSIVPGEEYIAVETDATVTSSFNHKSTALKRKASTEDNSPNKKIATIEETSNTMEQLQQAQPQEQQSTQQICSEVFEEFEFDEFEESELIDDEFVTSFVYKGEDQVQMPKDYYISEKIKLLKQIHEYKKTLKSLQSIINNAIEK